MALRHTCQALTGLTKYLINYCDFKYVLLGKIQSDAIERRFGHIRQLSGANYFISMRQLLESDRKLRALSLVKYSHISVKDIEEAVQAKHSPDYETTSEAEVLYGDLQFNILPNKNDLGVIYYVTGYCCRSLVRTNKCEKCKEATISDVCYSHQDVIPDDAHEFLADINRGGLWKPTPELFAVGCLCWRIFAELCSETLRENFLNLSNHRGVFIELVSISFYESEIISPWSISILCEKAHNILKGISIRFFNTMSKNILRQVNDQQPSTTQRKIRKLTGKNASN